MEYDLGVVMPVCGKFLDRLEDFKKYGLVNIKDRKIILYLVLSNDHIEGLELGWDKNITVRIVENDCPNYISNIYRFYAQLEQVEARWMTKVDDDSCTDVDGLLSNLDEFYDSDRDFYLGASLANFKAALEGEEGTLYPEYAHMLGNYKRFAPSLKNEIECGVVSCTAMKRILAEKRSLDFIKFRSKFYGGYTDCVISIAAAMIKIYPLDCPFLTHLPLLNNFSLVGGVFNHIHLISRDIVGENFYWERASKENYILLTKIIDKTPSEIESSLVGSKFLLDTDHALRTYEFKENHILKAKFEGHNYMWMEHEQSIYIINGNELIHKLTLNPDGDLFDGRIVLKRI